MSPLAPRTLTALRTTRSCFGVDGSPGNASSPFGAYLTSTASDLGSFVFFLGLIAATFLV